MALSYKKSNPLPIFMTTILYKYLLGEELVFDDVKRVNLNTANAIESIE
jgi:hypothetical protein